MSITIESCCASVEDVVTSEKAGIQRVELNSAIELGGLTPGSGMVRVAKENTDIPVMAMLRPRTGGFCYTDAEFKNMKQDCIDMIDAGADGIVFGILNKHGFIDSNRCAEIARIISVESMKKPKRVQMIFHRAFDIIEDWRTAMDELVALGFDRILTSGQKATAQEAIKTLKEMNEYANNRIDILVCGRIRLENAEDIVDKTGINQIHLRYTQEVKDKFSSSKNSKIKFNTSKKISEDSYQIVDFESLKALNVELNSKWL